MQTTLQEWQDHLEAVLPNDGGEPMAVRVYKQTASTQDIAKTFAPRKALVIADQQTAGRGRLGRAWQSTPGASVLMSVCWPNAGMGATHDRVSMLVGVAVAQAVQQIAPDATLRLKWPNDLMIDGKKLAGILIEAVAGAFIIGIGLNVKPEACPDPALRPFTTCLADLRRTVDRLRVIEAIMHALEQTLSGTDSASALKTWRAYAALGQTQTFEQAGQRVTGQVIDLDADHGLVVRRDTGEIVTLPAATTSVVS